LSLALVRSTWRRRKVLKGLRLAKVFGCDLGKIDRYGKILDFYYWKGILCVRMYPRKVTQPGTPDQKKTWEALKYANEEYNALAQNERDAWGKIAEPSQMTGRDFFIKTILKGYAKYGPNHARLTIRFRPEWTGIVTVTLEKTPNCKVRLMGMYYYNVWKALYWKEITPTLRGKKMLRRWELVEQPQWAEIVQEVPAHFTRWEASVMETTGPHWWTASVLDGYGVGYGRAGLYHF
jgi:hypothetical protein